MNFFQKIEAKHGGRGIPNIMLYLCVIYTIGWVINLMIPSLYTDILCLDVPKILHGQIWRLVTWLMYPPSSSILFGLIMIYVYWILGRNLEMVWSSFQLTWFLISGVIIHIIGAFVLYAIYGMGVVILPGQFMITPANFTLSIMLAFMATFPDAQFLLFFVVPVKAKYLGILYIAITILDFINGTVGIRTQIICSIVNILIFFWMSGKFDSIIWRLKNKIWQR